MTKLFALVALCLIQASQSFLMPIRPTPTFALQMAKRKPSMKERLKRRAKKMPAVAFTGERPEYLDKIGRKDEGENDAKPAPAVNPNAKKITDPDVATRRAADLLQAQRDSVAMLTMVRERVEAVLRGIDLEEQGYLVIDNFLDDPDALAKLQEEPNSLLASEAMTADINNLGSGEYVLPIKGGEEQYKQCPRIVEVVVATTKHVPEQQVGKGLDPSACMATLRTFDRNAYRASLELLTGSAEDAEAPQKPFRIVADEEIDQRKVSLLYYMVPETWNGACGGGVSIESTGETIEAQNDRLIILRSDSTMLRKEAWIGNDDSIVGSCLELHLVKKAE